MIKLKPDELKAILDKHVKWLNDEKGGNCNVPDVESGDRVSDLLKQINEITLKIGFHENRIALHKSALSKLRKEKSLLMDKGEWVAERDGGGKSMSEKLKPCSANREEFMEFVYDELSDDADNYRANRIIDAAEDYARSYAENILPAPCTNVKEKTAREWFAKINEELDELKAVVLRECTTRNRLEDIIDGVDDDTDTDIAEEAADTITAITSMLEAMGIDEDMRQEAQRKVNEKNKQRGYW